MPSFHLEYNIGDKLYEFAIMGHQEFEKLKAIYTQLIELVCYAKETKSEDEKYYPDEFYRDLEEDEYIKFFETIRDLLIENLIEEKLI